MQVQKCGKATTSNHTWNEGCHFSIQGDISTLMLEVALISKGMMSNKAVGFVKCPLRDILVFYVACESGAIKNTEVALDVLEGIPKLEIRFDSAFLLVVGHVYLDVRIRREHF